MTKKIEMKSYQKPEIIRIDDPAFDETGQGSSGFHPIKGNNGNHYGENNGNHYGGNNVNHYGKGGPKH